MPLMRPEVQNVLRAAGLEKESSNPEETISGKLDRAGLSQDEIAEELAHLAKNSGNEVLRLRALETGLKAHGALKETAPQIPTFNLIIQSASPSKEVPSVNPVLFPRQSLALNATLPPPEKVD